MPTDRQWLMTCVRSAEIFQTCSRRAYFSIILDENGMVAGTGWNGVPSGQKHCIDGGCPRVSSPSEHGSSYDNCNSIHAEANALLHSDWTNRSNGDGSTLYVNGPPCFSCAKLIANSGVKRIVCLSDDNYPDWPRVKQFILACGIRIHEFSSEGISHGI